MVYNIGMKKQILSSLVACCVVAPLVAASSDVPCCQPPKEQARAEIKWVREICVEKDRYIGWPTVCRLANGDLLAVFSGDASACPAESVLEMACVGGAKAMGLDNCTDVAPGMKADLVVLDLQRPNMQPENNVVKNIVYAGSKENVRLTMVNSRVLYENGEYYTGEDPAALYARVNAHIREMFR